MRTAHDCYVKSAQFGQIPNCDLVDENRPAKSSKTSTVSISTNDESLSTSPPAKKVILCILKMIHYYYLGLLKRTAFQVPCLSNLPEKRKRSQDCDSKQPSKKVMLCFWHLGSRKPDVRLSVGGSTSVSKYSFYNE